MILEHVDDPQKVHPGPFSERRKNESLTFESFISVILK